MQKKGTKEKILEASLELFSVRGFEGVSVKQIAKAVGIKDSSLYKHFSSKQEIYDTLLNETRAGFEETIRSYRLPQGAIEQLAHEYGRQDLVWLKQACEAVFLFFLKDPTASKFRRMLMIEQFKDKNAAKTLSFLLFDEAIEFQEALFAEMIEQEYFIQGDPQIIALEFYGPFYLLLNQYDNNPEGEDEAIEILMKHIEQFASVYQTKRGNINES